MTFCLHAHAKLYIHVFESVYSIASYIVFLHDILDCTLQKCTIVPLHLILSVLSLTQYMS